MAGSEEREAVVNFTVTHEYTLEGTFADVARALGIPVKKLTAIIDDDDEWPEVKSVTKLTVNADQESEEITIDEITEA